MGGGATLRGALRSTHITEREHGISDWKAQKLSASSVGGSRASAFYASTLPSRPILCGMDGEQHFRCLGNEVTIPLAQQALTVARSSTAPSASFTGMHLLPTEISRATTRRVEHRYGVTALQTIGANTRFASIVLAIAGRRIYSLGTRATDSGMSRGGVAIGIDRSAGMSCPVAGWRCQRISA